MLAGLASGVEATRNYSEGSTIPLVTGKVVVGLSLEGWVLRKTLYKQIARTLKDAP